VVRVNVSREKQNCDAGEKNGYTANHVPTFGKTLKNLSGFFELFDRRAGAEQIPVTVNVVDPRD
jgi:hypothetical protein